MLRLSVLVTAFVMAHASTGAAQMDPRLTEALAFVAELSEFAQRPQGTPAEWTKALEPLQDAAPRDPLLDQMAAVSRRVQTLASMEPTGGRQVILEQSPSARDPQQTGWPKWSDENQKLF